MKLLCISASAIFVRELVPAPPYPELPDGVTIHPGSDGLLPIPEGAAEIAVLRFRGEPANVKALFETPGGLVLGGDYTRPEHRGRGFSRLTYLWFCARLAGRGVRRVFASSDLANRASRRAILASGFRPDRIIPEFRVGPFDLGKWWDALARRCRTP